jgi:hypothetical protein
MRQLIHLYAPKIGFIVGCTFGMYKFITLQRKQDREFIQNHKLGKENIPTTDPRPIYLGSSIALRVTWFGIGIGWLAGP